MQTSLQRRQRHRRSGAARRGSGGSNARRIALAIPLLLFSSFLVLGAVGFITAVSAYAYYSRDLPDPAEAFKDLTFDSPTSVYDRTGQVKLATFGEHRRELVTFDQIPPEMIDATTSIEDKDFWTNPGFDLGGFIAATVDTLTGHPRGGSTITQQLVRARLLPESAFAGSVYDRKIKEIIQSIRLTQAYNGNATEGKQKIIEAYLNQNFYGNQSYGIKAAGLGYFGKDLPDLSLAQMAILAALPQSPTEYDLVRNAIEQCTVTPADDGTCPAGKSQLVVPDTSAVVQRRNQILQLMETRSVLSKDKHTIADYEAAMAEPVILASQATPQWKAPQFVWQVREQLGALLCGVESKDACQQVDTGGYTVTTTLDWKMQQSTEKWLYIAARIPQAKTLQQSKNLLKAQGVPQSDWGWVLNFRGKNINNDAGVVLDYRNGQILAYGGSAGYYLPGTKKFQPQYDVLSDAFRQMGSAVKPINYVTAIDDRAITAATVFMDVVTDFGRGFAPADADKLERGPVRARSALQFSLNIPAIKLSMIQGLNRLYQRTLDFGFVYPPSIQGPVASMAIGTLEMHAIDLTSAFGAIANGGMLVPRTTILEVKDRNGNVVYPTPQNAPSAGEQVVSPQAAFVVTDILQGNTLKSQNAYWARWAVYEKGQRRPATVKTGTTDDNKDITAFGYVAPPTDPKAPAIVVGVWMGNSDSTPAGAVTSVGSSEALWNHIITAATKGMPIADFKKPKGIVSATVDAFSGQLPGPYTVKTVTENFISGTQPTAKDTLHVPTQIDSATGKLWQDGCDGPMTTDGFLDFSSMEPSFPGWQPYTQGWAQRAAKGPGVRGGPKRTATTYFFDGYLVPFGRTWGGKFAPTEVCQPVAPPPVCGPGGGGGPPGASPTPCTSPPPTPAPTPTKGGKPTPSPLPSLALPAPTAPP